MNNEDTYSIPIYENGVKTEWSVDGIIGDEKYFKLLELGNGKDLPDMINTTTKQQKVMNKEQQELLDEAYQNYKRTTHDKNELNGNWGEYSRWGDNPLIAGVQHLTKGSFIQMIKVNPEFSKNWGLKIEERELSKEERYNWYINTHNKNLTRSSNQFDMDYILNTNNIPTKLITITYNDKTIESYENNS